MSNRVVRSELSRATPTRALHAHGVEVCYHRRRRASGVRSDRLPVAEEFVVLFVAAVAAADFREVREAVYPPDPLDLLETELRFVAEPPGRAVTERQGIAVHVIGKHGQVVTHLLDGMRVLMGCAS